MHKRTSDFPNPCMHMGFSSSSTTIFDSHYLYHIHTSPHTHSHNQPRMLHSDVPNFPVSTYLSPEPYLFCVTSPRLRSRRPPFPHVLPTRTVAKPWWKPPHTTTLRRYAHFSECTFTFAFSRTHIRNAALTIFHLVHFLLLISLSHVCSFILHLLFSHLSHLRCNLL